MARPASFPSPLKIPHLGLHVPYWVSQHLENVWRLIVIIGVRSSSEKGLGENASCRQADTAPARKQQSSGAPIDLVGQPARQASLMR